jgi:hypothetical protein
MGHQPDHRGATAGPAAFAASFVAARFRGFDKDLKICLTPVAAEHRSGVTHAYFPALASCCSTLEYLTALYRGNARGIGWQQIHAFAVEYLPQPEYDVDAVKVLFNALRHPVAHRGIASGVTVEPAPSTRRIVWRITASSIRPACRLVADVGVLTKDSPWPTPYTHRVHINLRRLGLDLRSAAEDYGRDIQIKPELVANFQRCMHQLYPT